MKHPQALSGKPCGCFESVMDMKTAIEKNENKEKARPADVADDAENDVALTICVSTAMKSTRTVARRCMSTATLMPEQILESLPRQISKVAKKQQPKFSLTMPPQQLSKTMPPQEPINVSSVMVAEAVSSGTNESKRSMFAMGCVAVGAAVAKLEMDRSTRDGLSPVRYGDRTGQPSVGLFGL